MNTNKAEKIKSTVKSCLFALLIVFVISFSMYIKLFVYVPVVNESPTFYSGYSVFDTGINLTI